MSINWIKLKVFIRTCENNEESFFEDVPYITQSFKCHEIFHTKKKKQFNLYPFLNQFLVFLNPIQQWNDLKKLRIYSFTLIMFSWKNRLFYFEQNSVELKVQHTNRIIPGKIIHQCWINADLTFNVPQRAHTHNCC